MQFDLNKGKNTQIPTRWNEARLRNFIKLSSGRSRPKDFKYSKDIVYAFPIYGGNGILGYAKEFSYDKKTIILGRVGEYCGVIHKNESKCWISDNALYIKEFVNKSLDIDYLAYSLEYKNLNNLKAKSGQPLINQSVVGAQKILVPPLPEQHKIAEILSTVDDEIEKTDAIIKKTQQLKKGLMQKLFTEGIWHTRFKETKIGRIPDEWDVKKVGELGDFFRGKTITKSEIQETGFPCIRYGDIYVQYKLDNIVTHFSAYIGKETAEKGQKLFYGDILFAGTGETAEDIGKCVAYTKNDEAYAGGDLVVFRPRESIKLNSAFLSFCLNSGDVARRRSRLGQGLSIFHIYAKDLRTLMIPFPKIDEQNQITEMLSEVDIKIEKEQTTKEQLGILKKGLMQVLLTGKVRVEV